MHKGKNKMLGENEVQNKGLKIEEDFLPTEEGFNEYYFKEQDGREAVTIKAKTTEEAIAIYNKGK